MDNFSSTSDKQNFPADKTLVVSLFSDCNFLSLSVLENLLSKNCFINIVTDNKKEWQESTLHLSGNRRYSLMEAKDFEINLSPYSIIISGYGSRGSYGGISNILKKVPNNDSKVLMLFPFEKYSFEENSRFNFSANLGVVYLGDLLGARMDLRNDLFVTKTIQEIYFKRTMHLSVGELFYPVFVNDVAKVISRWLFSFGPYGKETLLIGPQTSAPAFWKENSSLVGEIKVEYDGETKPRILPKGVEIKTLNTDLRFLLTETYTWLTKSPPIKQQSVRKKKKSYPKYLKPLMLTLGFTILFPFLFLATAFGTSILSYKQFTRGNDGASESSMLLTKTLCVISKQVSRGFSYTPLIGKIYGELEFTAAVCERGSEIFITSIPLVRNSSYLLTKVLGNEIYDPSIPASAITRSLDSLYREISLLQADSNDSMVSGVAVSKAFLKKVDLDKFKNLTIQLKNLSQNLPQILGKGESKTYLVLFQNNMELRPTGGFIGSFGILTFDEGRISDLTISDVYSADGQLNGHVEPPAPIKKYLGEANWWLRDSNWDPDFPTSARRAEWFLDKEMGRSVDGVFGIDLSPIKNALKYTGPVFLPDFNMDITSENLYQKTQAEVQENFFPGTHKKASFLTALSRSLLASLSSLEPSQKIGILKSIYNDLEGRSIQVFFHDDGSQKSVSALRWDGAVATPDCGPECFIDVIGVVEANLGVNKTNYFIEREQDLDITLSPDSVTRTMTITLKNNANPALGASSVYKTYVRLLSDGNSVTTAARLHTGQSVQNLSSEVVNLKGRNETGVYLEVLGGQTKTLEFSWTSDVAPGTFTTYGVYLRKQAGTGADPVSLTVNGASVYNDLLAGDVFSRLNW